MPVKGFKAVMVRTMTASGRSTSSVRKGAKVNLCLELGVACNRYYCLQSSDLERLAL